MADELLYKPYEIDTSSLAADRDSGLGPRTTLTGMHLLEGIVALKTLHGLAYRMQDPADEQYLREAAEDLPLLPDALGPTYHLALRLCDAAIGPSLVGTPRPLRAWPTDVASGPRMLTDIAFLYLADLALHLPPAEVMTERLADGRNALEDFMPVPRFARAIRVIQENRGFPPADEGGSASFYQVLFEFVAQRAGWPGYEETQGMWEGKLQAMRDHYRGSMSDGFRFRLLVERRKDANVILLRDSIFACMKQAVPVLHLTPTGLKVLRLFVFADGKMVSTPFEFPSYSPWGLMEVNAVKWQNSTKEGGIELELNRGLTFMQEVVMRSMSRALQPAVLRGGCLACPWAKRGCHVAEPGCARIRRLGDIPRHECALRRYVTWLGIEPDNVVWDGDEPASAPGRIQEAMP